MWKAQYPNGQRVIIGGNPANMTEADRKSIGKLVLPINKPVKLTLTSEDVIHDFGVPAFRSKIDVLPGRYTTAWYQPTKLGEYHIFCDQYCGTWHSLMVGKIAVVKQEEYRRLPPGVQLPAGDGEPGGRVAGARGSATVPQAPVHQLPQRRTRPRRRRCWSGCTAAGCRSRGGGAEIADDHYIIESRSAVRG